MMHSLSAVLQNIKTLEKDISFHQLHLDSRQIKTGDVFVAYPGSQADGRDFMRQAATQGAAAILAEEEGLITTSLDCPVIAIKQLAEKVSLIAANYFQHPSKQLTVYATTGTNGKTSVSFFIAQCLKILNVPCGFVGTIGSGLPDQLHQSSLTTPDAISMQRLLADFVKQKLSSVALEASSHALHQHRLAGIDVDTAIFTNLTREHLDYHGDMQAYGQAKKILFTMPGVKHSIINVDDQFGQQLATQLNNTITVGIKYPADVMAKNIQASIQGLSAEIKTPWGEGTLTTTVLGDFQIDNMLVVIAALAANGYPLAQILQALQQVNSAPGRMQTLRAPGAPLIVVDYAHSPDALAQALKTLAKIKKNQLWCVFGCGGDRDKGKRPQMGKVAQTYADKIILTDDNPRTENSLQIIEDIQQGITQQKKIMIQAQRQLAIEQAIQSADADDIILIAGKGHEDYQIIGHEKHPFSDINIAAACLENNNNDAGKSIT